MLKIRLSEETLAFDPSDLPAGDKFHRAFASISSAPVPPGDLIELAFLYRGSYENARRILDLAKRKAASNPSCTEGVLNDIKINLLGLEVHHNKAMELDFYDLNNIQDKRIDLLKGFYLYKKKDYDDAYFSFSKISYRFGMELCQFVMQEKISAVPGDDQRIRCYADPKEWDAFENNDPNTNMDFLFRIGKAERYENENNIDVRLALIENAIDTGSPDTDGILEQLEALHNDFLESAEICYLIGKVHHIKKQYETAREYYEMALQKDPEYLPAGFNLKKIDGKQITTETRHPCMNDYKALICMRNNTYDFNFNGCSDQIRKLCFLIIKVRDCDPSAIGDLREYLSPGQKEANLFDREVLYNNMALLHGGGAVALEMLESALADCGSKYEDYIRYNIGVMTKNAGVLGGLALPEAGLHVALLGSNTETGNADLQRYILMKDNKEKARDAFKEEIANYPNRKHPKTCYVGDSYLFSLICLGSIYIDEYLDDKTAKEPIDSAVKTYQKNLKSFYCVNGLAICYALQDKVDLALRLLEQISDEYNNAYYNMAACYVLKREYPAALECLHRLREEGRDDGVHGLVASLCGILGDVQAVDKCIERGFPGLEGLRNEISALGNGENQRDVEKEEARKRKIREIEESRKRLHFN